MDGLDQEKKTAAQAVAEVAQKANEAVQKIQRTSDDRVTESLKEALREVFGENERSGRFVDVSRIPLICQNINGIHMSLETLVEWTKNADERYVNQDQFDPVKRIVYGLVSLILVGVIVALLALVIKK